MSLKREDFDEIFEDKLDQFSKIDIASDDAVTAMSVLEKLSKLRPAPEPEPVPEPVIVEKTKMQKAQAWVGAVLDNETTRVAIKAAGAFGGVALVVWSTVKRDHVLQREAMTQANQRPS